ncbi:MAG: hypothetical protein EBT79_13545 [Actinobacteria bacterium]|nr:hypothetical protein [Actinomycetota bacterium]
MGTSSRRVASRWILGADFGPRVPLMEGPSGPLRYRVKADQGGILVAVYAGSRRVGAMDAYAIGNVHRLTCSADALVLLSRHPELEDTSRPRWVSWGQEVPNVKSLSVSHADVYDETMRGHGIGREMYLTVMREWFDRVGPFLFTSDACSPVGSTSNAAQRVWKSLSTRFPASGEVVAVLTRP